MALAKTVLNMDNPNYPWMNFVKFAADHAVIPAWINMRTNISEKNSCFVAKHHLPTVPPKSRVSQCFSDHTRLTSPTSTSLAHQWREIQGLNNWENLIQPSLHPLLQSEIIRYGKFVTACYEAFDLDPGSPRYLNCKYGRRTVLGEVGLGDSGYQVTKYIYATAPDINIPTQDGAPSGRWVGYIAVSTDLETARLGRRDVLVTFRGTITNAEWIANLMSALSPARLDPHESRSDVKVEAGFLSLYTSSESDTRFGLGSCREQLLSEISRLVRKYKDEEMSITLAGHSMGSSLALLLAYDIAELGLNYRNRPNWSGMSKKIPLTVFSFAGPRVGNVQFKERCEELGVKVLRIVHAGDPITKLPGVVFNELTFRVLGGKYDQFPWSYDCYAHVGVELVLDFLKDMEDEEEEEEVVHQMPEMIDQYASPEKGLLDFSKISRIFCVHDMETYIGLLMRCSKRRRKIDRKLGLDFLGKAKELLLNTAQWRDALPWREATIVLWCCLIIGNQIKTIIN